MRLSFFLLCINCITCLYCSKNIEDQVDILLFLEKKYKKLSEELSLYPEDVQIFDNISSDLRVCFVKAFMLAKIPKNVLIFNGEISSIIAHNIVHRNISFSIRKLLGNFYEMKKKIAKNNNSIDSITKQKIEILNLIDEKKVIIDGFAKKSKNVYDNMDLIKQIIDIEAINAISQEPMILEYNKTPVSIINGISQIAPVSKKDNAYVIHVNSTTKLISPMDGVVLFADINHPNAQLIIKSHDIYIAFCGIDSIFVEQGEFLTKKQLIGVIYKKDCIREVLMYGVKNDSYITDDILKIMERVV